MNLYLVLFILNAIFGLLAFEWAWKKVKVLREINEERDSKFPPFRRYDAVLWKKWKFYFGAMTFMLFRVISCFVSLVFLYISVKIVTIGHNFRNEKPLKGWRDSVLGVVYKTIARYIALMCGIRIKKEDMDYDYSYYLGPDYKTTSTVKYVSTYVCNHTSWLDIIILISQIKPAFAAKAGLKNIPVFGLLCKALGCIFIARGATQETRTQIIEQITERQKLIEESGEYPPLVVFAEGGTSNGKYMLSFKKGAFAGIKAVKPVVMKYHFSMFNPAYDIIPYFPSNILQACLFDYMTHVKVLPSFVPNEYLFKTHADKGKEHWEIYAWAVRDIMSKVGCVEKSEMPYREKLRYEVVLGLKKEQDFKED